MPCAAKDESSRNGVPGSSSRLMRSRASNFPRATCRARASALPPCIAASRSARFLEQLSADQHAPDLTRPRPDLVELGIAQVSPGRIVVDVAVAAEELNRVERHLGGVLGGVEDGAGGVLARGLAAIARLGDGIDIGLARVHPDIHVGELALDQLKFPDRLPTLLA